MGQNASEQSVKRMVFLLKYIMELLFPAKPHNSYHVHSDLAHYCLAMLLPEGLYSGLLLGNHICQYVFQILKREVERLSDGQNVD